MSDARDIIEQLLRRSRGGGPKGPGGPRTIPTGTPELSWRAVLIGIGLLAAIWAGWSAIYTVQPEERAVIKRFGRVIGIADNGAHLKLPFGIDRVQIVATERVLKQEFGFRTDRAEQTDRARTQFAGGYPNESLMLTGDLNIIQVEWVVQYRIDDPVKYLYGMREPTKTLRDLSESVMRRIVGNRIGSDVLTVGRIEIANTARDEIQDAMTRYDNGIKVITVQLQDVIPPLRVQPAFNEVNEARQLLEKQVNDAQKSANEAIPRAEGTAKRTIAEAEGYGTERVNRARGEAARFNSVLAEYKRAPDVTRARLYLEALNQVLPKIGSVVVVQDGQTSPLPLLNLRDGQRLPQKPEASR
ncbi:MAG TPA: FtsH protease activity modulator HflK [Gammaproteobacteria bacterium]|nr:FtsH protease activity modulator HflK [Gammaproteobacteria bacterium]